VVRVVTSAALTVVVLAGNWSLAVPGRIGGLEVAACLPLAGSGLFGAVGRRVPGEAGASGFRQSRFGAFGSGGGSGGGGRQPAT